MPQPGNGARGRTLAVVALTSLSLIALELVWTRIFSAEFFYTFAFLILSLAILGLGMGALALRLFPGLGSDRALGVHLSLSGLTAIAGPILVFRLGLDFSQMFSSPAMAGKLVLTILILSAPFFFGGIVLGRIFRNAPAEMPRLYMADLVGAGAGVAVILWCMNSLGTPMATFLCAIPILAAAFLASPGWLRALPAALVVVALVLGPSSADLLKAERPARAPIIYTHWDAMAKVKLYAYNEQWRGIEIDNVANSPVGYFDGNFESPELQAANWGIDVSWLIQRFDDCTFLSLGAGGGGDVMQALVEGAARVHAVEVNPHINRMMLYGDPDGYIRPEPEPEIETASLAGTAAAATTTESEEAETETEDDAGGDDGDGGEEAEGTEDKSEEAEEESKKEEAAAEAAPEKPPVPSFLDEDGEIITLAKLTGHLYQDPRVTVVSEDARSYIRRHRNEFDIIYSLSSNTWAALGSGSFAFAESYIFTKEAYQDYWRSLSENGFLSMEHQVYMPRIVSAVMEGLEELGVPDPTAHFAVYNLPKMRRNLLLLSKQPLTDEIRQNAYGPLTPEKHGDIHLLYPAEEGDEGNLVNRIVTKGWRAAADLARVDVSPSTDNRPFVAQMGLWRNLDWDHLEKVSGWADFSGFPLSKMIIFGILAVIIILALPLTLLPYIRKGDSLRRGPWLYFFLIGLAFMCVEVVLIQKYSLFIGASIYSISTVLLTLLVASGIGSRFSKRVSDGVAFPAIILLILLEALVLGHVTNGLAGLPLFLRLAVVAILTAPLGFFMGMPFPKGAMRVGELVDWGFAVNGIASVLGATAIVVVAFSYGFTAALLVGAGLYLAAYGVMALKPAW